METEVEREKKKKPTQFSTTLYIPLTLAKGENLIIYDASCYFFFFLRQDIKKYILSYLSPGLYPTHLLVIQFVFLKIV